MSSEIQPTVKVSMMIRRPAAQVYDAFIDPLVTTHFWFTKSSGKLEEGQTVRWDWEMYGASTDVVVHELEANRRILISWSGSPHNLVEWVFTPRNENETMVTVTNWGFVGSSDEVLAEALDSMGGFSIVLCGAKAYLEHGLELNLIADKAPEHLVEGWR